MADFSCKSMQRYDTLVALANRYKWLLPVAVFALSLVSVEIYFDTATSFAWLWASNALAVLWLTLDAHYRSSNRPDPSLFLGIIGALFFANYIGDPPWMDSVAMTFVNSIEIYAASCLFSGVVNQGCSLTDGRGFALKLLKVGCTLLTILGGAALVITLYFNTRYGAPLAYGAGAWLASSLASYIFVLPVLLAVCNPEPRGRNPILPVLLVLGFMGCTYVIHLFPEPLLYDFVLLSVSLAVAALSLRLVTFALVGYLFIALELIYLQHEVSAVGLDPLQINLDVSVLAAIVVSVAIIMSRSRLLQQLTSEALVRSEDKQHQLELALRCADISLFEIDLESDEATMLEGSHPEYAIGSRVQIEQILNENLLSIAEAVQFRDALKRDNAQATYAVRYGPESTRYWARIFTGASYQRNGRQMRLMTRQDVTDLMLRTESLRETSERQRELFAVIGHELRTPVASIAMVTDANDLSDKEKLHTISDISRNLLGVLEDLRSVVVPERARGTKDSAGSPETVVERAVNTVVPLAKEQGVSVHLRLSGIEPIYRFRQQALRQLVTNLVKNAVLHSQGRNVWVSVTEMQADEGRSLVRLCVEDDGTGIPEDQIERLFQAFSRGDTQCDGTGLGLFIARELSEELGGSLEYHDSEIHGGACFVACFPLEQVEAQAQAKAQASISLDGMRILLAEDDRMLRMLTEKALRNRGANVYSFENGKLALNAWTEGNFDLILTDLMMPEMNGLEFTAALRAQGCKIPILAVTAAVVGTETDQLLASGADGVIAKPITIDALVDELARMEQESVDV